MTTPFKELSGSPREFYGPDGMKAQRRLLCAWNDRNALVQEILGDGYQFGGENPVAYPDVSSVLAVQVQVEPLTDDMIRQELTELDEGLNAYQGFAKVTVNYETLMPTALSALPDVSPLTFLTYRLELDYETVAYSGGNLYWPGNPQATFPTDAQGTLRIPVTHHRLTWHRVVNPPWTAIRQTSGSWNEAEFLGAPAGTLLFDGATAEREFLSISELNQPEFGWCIEYIFRENPLVLQPNQNIFRTSDFFSLLQFEE
ncbi:MAG TPA: hypothetical protein VIH42_01020 [Thermoguttaceae bacterium]